MKALFLTSSLGCSIKLGDARVPTACDNSNGFIDALRKEVGDEIKLTIVASNPNNVFKTESQAFCLTEGLKFDGFYVDDVAIVDSRFKGDLKDLILSSNVVFLCGGHVPTQNNYFRELGLKEILNNYNGVVIGQSAGSMNCAKLVYAQPECEEEFLDPTYNKFIEGLGLTDIIVMPHMNRAKTDTLCGQTTYGMCLEDSYKCPHYGITDGGYILIKDDKAEAFGRTTYFKDGKEIVLCEDGQSIIIDGCQESREK